MALESLNAKSKIVVHNSATDLVDKTPLQAYQGVVVEDVNFEKVVSNLTATVPSAKGGQNYPNAKQGQSVMVGNMSSSGAARRFVCLGDYGTSIPFNMEIPIARITTNSTALTAQTTFVEIDLENGGGNGLITHSSGNGKDLKLKYKSDTTTITELFVSYFGTGFKAGDTLTLTGLDGQVDDIVITLTGAEVNHGIWVFEAFASIEDDTANTPWAQ